MFGTGEGSSTSCLYNVVARLVGKSTKKEDYAEMKLTLNLAPSLTVLPKENVDCQSLSKV